MGKCEGSRLVGGTRLVVFPRFLTRTGRRTPRAGTPTPLRAGTPPSSRPPPTLLHLFGKGQGARGPGSRGGSRLMAFSNCERFGRGNTTSRVPPTSRDPLLLQGFQTIQKPNLKGGTRKGLSKTAFWTIVSPHDALSAPLACFKAFSDLNYCHNSTCRGQTVNHRQMTTSPAWPPWRGNSCTWETRKILFREYFLGREISLSSETSSVSSAKNSVSSLLHLY